MGHRIIWNDEETKIKVYSTISDGFVTEDWQSPEDLLKDFHVREIVLEQVLHRCARCNQVLPGKKLESETGNPNK